VNYNKKTPVKKINDILALYIACLSLASCRIASNSPQETLEPFDLQILKKAPEKSQFSTKGFVKKQKKSSPFIPAAMKKCVSITITEEVPLKDALIELARQVEINLQLDPKITGRIFFSATRRPFIDVIKDICDMVDLRYKIFDQSLRVEFDAPYAIHYPLSFLNLSRTSENRISIATDVFSNVKTASSMADNGSNSAITGKGNSDFWTELDSNLKTILADSQTTASLKEGSTKPTYAIHRQGGLITVYGTSRHHALVTDYLENLQQVISTQVLIEAKVIEVSLNDQYRGGINWQKLTGGDFYADISLGDLGQRGLFMPPANAQTDMLTIGLRDKTFSGLLKAIEEFGASRTLSSPRLTVLNNQTAILKVAQNQVYFRLNYDKQLNLSVDRESINVSSDIQTVPIGLVMSVHPSIDQNTGDIILSLRPTISRLTHSVSDPAVEIAFANAKSLTPTGAKPSLIPVVEVREIDSVLRLQSGEIAVLGGLMETRVNNGAAKVPVVGDFPILGQAFTSTADGEEVVELVILLRASILDGTPSPDAADQRLYQDYFEDPRPFKTS